MQKVNNLSLPLCMKIFRLRKDPFSIRQSILKCYLVPLPLLLVHYYYFFFLNLFQRISVQEKMKNTGDFKIFAALNVSQNYPQSSESMPGDP